ncbi:hypothetical protein IFT64_02480 [Oxalobacteraceae sp. CFBP 8753]|nr:hypothetical protein [Oxalobacteraceae sp. CFBP 8753]
MTFRKSLIGAGFLLPLCMQAQAAEKTTIYYAPSGNTVIVVDGLVIGRATNFQPVKQLKFRPTMVAGDTPEDPGVPDTPNIPEPREPKPPKDPTPKDPTPKDPPCSSGCCDILCPPGPKIDQRDLIKWAPVIKNTNVVNISDRALKGIR